MASTTGPDRGVGAHQVRQTFKLRSYYCSTRGNFCLLCFHPGQVRPSLDSLDPFGSHEDPILMPSLARTPYRYRAPSSRVTALKPSNDTGFQVAGLQEHATTPSR
ncbi:hypothetical protein CHS0354_011765 [Potamilus streckersoni]|uniref:Uncharacterized protein n=1 Tax=Potamilus streckersoni TaxID=2493646 RepID=A0AAE0TH85_9BIVA|nr:hypothetical protein CHS0354_011765 [Potamilus streckersoni]